MSCAETDEPIDMPFVSWIWMGLKKHQLLSGARIPQERDSFAWGGASFPTMRFELAYELGGWGLQPPRVGQNNYFSGNRAIFRAVAKK